MTTETGLVRVHIAASADGFGECLWAIPVNAAAGIYELDNFPINDVDFTSGDYVQVAANGSGELYVTGLAERRYQPAELKYDAPEREQRGILREYFETIGARVEWLMAGIVGVAVPVPISHEHFHDFLAKAPYRVWGCDDEEEG